jgi:hypothetical protein
MGRSSSASDHRVPRKRVSASGASSKGNSFRPSDLSLHPGAPRQPTRTGAVQCTGMSDALTTSNRMPARRFGSGGLLISHHPLHVRSRPLKRSLVLGRFIQGMAVLIQTNFLQQDGIACLPQKVTELVVLGTKLVDRAREPGRAKRRLSTPCSIDNSDLLGWTILTGRGQLRNPLAGPQSRVEEAATAPVVSRTFMRIAVRDSSGMPTAQAPLSTSS